MERNRGTRRKLGGMMVAFCVGAAASPNPVVEKRMQTCKLIMP